MKPNKKTTEATVMVSFRLEGRLLEELDGYAQLLREETPGRKATRADVVRSLLEQGLDAIETKRRSKR